MMASLWHQTPKHIQMKTRLFVSALLLLALGFLYSCDQQGVNGDTTNYWNANALTKMKLRGAVHTLTVATEGQTVYTFNTDGNLTSKVTTGATYSNSYTYAYENGKLISETSTYTNSSSPQRASSTSTTTYEYQNAGKYIPRGPFHLYEMGLVPSLSAVIYATNRQDYDFHGTDLWIVSSTNGVPSDTAIVKYTGDYPSSILTAWSYCNNMTYASNGMFVTYDEGFYGPNYDNKRAYTFLSDDTYLLINRMVNTNTGTNNSVETTNYTYNDKKDITEQSSGSWATQWANYIYDSAGNWTSRQTRYSTGETTWSAYTTETRSITYY